jgi:hypothetical protein
MLARHGRDEQLKTNVAMRSLSKNEIKTIELRKSRNPSYS